MQGLKFGRGAERDGDSLAVGEDADLWGLGVGAGQHKLAAGRGRGQQGGGG